MSTYEMTCFFCRGPITSTEIGDGDGEIIILSEGDDGIKSVAHREPCYETERRIVAEDERRRAKSENFEDWDSR